MGESGPPGRGGEFFTLLQKLGAFRDGPLGGDPSSRALARAAGVSPTTIGDWLRGARFPQEPGPVLAVVQAVWTAAGHRGVTVSTVSDELGGLLDEDRWTAAYEQEARRRAGVISGAVQQAQAAWALAGPRVRVRDADSRPSSASGPG